MAEQIPVLVKKDGERTPVASTMTRDELFAAMQMLIQSQQAGQATTDAKVEHIADAMAQIKSDMHKGDYNIANFADRSAFNPKGERDHPRPEIVGEVLMFGAPLDEREMTHDEITYANKIVPGIYHNGAWKVIDKAPHSGTRKLLVDIPCKEPDQRASLPSLVAILREIVAEAEAKNLVSA